MRVDIGFEDWVKEFTQTLADYSYFIDFEKVGTHVGVYEKQLRKLQRLKKSEDIKADFKALIRKDPAVWGCVPILSAIRGNTIPIYDSEKGKIVDYDFGEVSNEDICCVYMEKMGLFDVIKNKNCRNLVTLATGIEIGLDSNARKNRSGDLMENRIVEYIEKLGFKKNESYFRHVNVSTVEEKLGIDLEDRVKVKNFDYILKLGTEFIFIETNFYRTSGSKINDTNKSYITLSQELEKLPHCHFVLITDGEGWKYSQKVLKEIFETINVFNLSDLNKGRFVEYLKSIMT